MSTDQNAPSGVYWFGFGVLRKDEEGIEIKNIRTFDAPAQGCQWTAGMPKQCAALSPEHKTPENYGS